MWKTYLLTDCLVKHKINKKNQINRSEIKIKGKYPVIDQGKIFIAGFTDDDSKVVCDNLPYIIFGDHTRCFKYIDFSFVLGADGTKALKPKQELFDNKFFYYALLSLNIPNRGYNRHFKILQEQRIPVPPPEEQEKIAGVLSLVQDVIAQQEQLISLTAELKKTLMQKLFTEGTRGEPQKMTEIGLIPESWDLVKLKSLLREKLRNGHSAKETNDGNGVRTLTLTAVTQNNFSVANTKITCANKNKVKDLWLKSGDIFIERANTFDYVGLAALYEGQENFAIFPDLLIRVRVKEEIINSKIFADYLITSSCRNYFIKNAKGTAGNFPKIDQGIIENLFVPVPLPDEQKEIEIALRLTDKKQSLYQYKKILLENLFRTLLHQLMTAQIRVDDLNLSALNLKLQGGDE